MRLRLRVALAAVPVGFLGYFFVYPLVRLVIASTVDAEAFRTVLTDPRIRTAAVFTVGQAALSTVLTVLAALPLTAVIAHYRFPGRGLVRAWVTVPFVMPTVVVGAAFLALGWRGSLIAILAAHVFYNLAVVVRTVGTVWSRIDPSLTAAALTLGASRRRAFREVTLPLLAPALAAAASIVFLFCFTSFGVVLILGGLRYRTLEVEIYQRVVALIDLPTAAALALVQLVGIALIMAVYGRFQEQRAVRFPLVPESAVLRTPRSMRERATVMSVIAVTLILQSVPLAVLLSRSLAGRLAGWRFLANPGPVAGTPLSAVANSLRYAASTAVLAVVVGGIAAWLIARPRREGAVDLGRFLDLGLMLPLGTSAVTVGLALMLALDWPVDLRGTWVVVAIAHTLVAIPFVVRATVPTLRSIRPELRETAAVLGAPPSRVWREVDLPIVARAMAVGAGFAAAVSIGEFGATVFLARPATTTIPVLIYRLLARPGSASYGGAMAMSVILMATVAALMMALDRLRSGEIGTF